MTSSIALLGHRKLGVLLTSVLVGVLVACTPTESPSPPLSVPDISQMSGTEAARTVLDAARDDGASDLQVDALERAVASGKASFEDAAAAARRTIDCLIGIGATATYSEDVRNNDYPVPGYVIGGVDDAQAAAVETCERDESYWINYLYQAQPAARESVEREFNAARPVLIACLNRNNVTPEADATNEDLLYAALRLWEDTMAVNPDAPVHCLDEAGVTGY